MIFSENWLREWINPQMDTQQLMDQLTMAGLEVGGSKAAAHQFSGIVVAEVESVQKHPDADHLSLCQVSDGKETYNVVCGAPNVRAGLKVPFAAVGAEIITDENEKPFKIKAAKLRGIESHGMLCSAEELGLAEKSEGLLELPEDSTPGVDIRQFLGLDDISIELDLTPNRGDCLGMIGLAREVGVLARQDVTYPEIGSVDETIKEEFPITITAQDECPRYLGRIIRNINLNTESPLWMREKLRRSGLRSIDPIVDVTNYVLIEFGQPMHAFDYSKLEGKIDVRLAAKNEKLILLDGKELELTPGTLVIADSKKAIAMAGIMGGLATSVTAETEHVFLECAFFTPLAIAGKARSYGLRTDASHRYERGVDYQIQYQAMQRATELLLEIVGGEAGPVTEALGNLPELVQVELKFESIPSLLGIDIDHEEIIDILTRLGFGIAAQTDLALTVDVPSFRFDVSIEADLIEELARIYGYNKLPKTPGLVAQSLKTRSETNIGLSRIRQQMVALGYQEVVTYSFIDPAMAELICADSEAIRLENPISEDMSVMRASILPGLLSTLQYNENRQRERVRLFETGLVFTLENGEIQQRSVISGLVTGTRFPNNWSNNKDINDFYDVKGDIETLLGLGGNANRFRFSAADYGCFHSGQCARVEFDDQLVGHVGALHPAIRRELDLIGPTYLFELSLERVRTAALPRSTSLSRFPEVSRDLAIVIDESVTAAAILAEVKENAGEYLKTLRIFDVYQGDAVAKGKKSIALGLTWQHPSRTLSDNETNAIISSCVNALQVKFNANLRN